TGDSDEDADDWGEEDAERGDVDRVEQADEKGAGITIGGAVGDQRLADPKSSLVLEKAETGADAPLLEIRDGGRDEIDRQHQDHGDGDRLKGHCPSSRISPQRHALRGLHRCRLDESATGRPVAAHLVTYDTTDSESRAAALSAAAASVNGSASRTSGLRGSRGRSCHDPARWAYRDPRCDRRSRRSYPPA